MPFLYDKLLMLNRKLFRLGKFTRLHSDRLPQNHFPFHHKNGLTITALYMHVDWCVIVAVEKESKSVFDEYCQYADLFFCKL